MNIKKLISLFLSIMMLLGVVAMPVMADETGKAESDEAKAAIAELAAELPQTVAELKELGFEYVCATYGVDLYVIKDKENENFGDVYFVYSEQPGGEGKVLQFFGLHQGRKSSFQHPEGYRNLLSPLGRFRNLC